MRGHRIREDLPKDDARGTGLGHLPATGDGGVPAEECESPKELTFVIFEWREGKKTINEDMLIRPLLIEYYKHIDVPLPDEYKKYKKVSKRKSTRKKSTNTMTNRFSEVTLFRLQTQ